MDKRKRDYQSICELVLQINPFTLITVGIFNSIKEAFDITGIRHISEACSGNIMSTAGGYYWRRYSDYFTPTHMRTYYDKTSNKFVCDPIDMMTYSLSNYIEPCFTILPGEKWKDVKDYEGLYQVSDFGRVISLLKKPYIQLMTPCLRGDKYLFTVFKSIDGYRKEPSIHRLVAEAFILNPDNLPEVNHKDEDKTNNHVSNLEWCTRRYNSMYGNMFLNKLMPVEQIDVNTGKVITTYLSMGEASRITGISQGNISSVCSGTTLTAGGYFWRKLDKNSSDNVNNDDIVYE